MTAKQGVEATDRGEGEPPQAHTMIPSMGVGWPGGVMWRDSRHFEIMCGGCGAGFRVSEEINASRRRRGLERGAMGADSLQGDAIRRQVSFDSSAMIMCK